ncbi:hypothetical protein SAMN05428988_4603 [Chitinophaga sp. YR573]|uniref:hypothetical protein n=1 Tax=Chitinophaga sp. YR573 TaxID=1881040 RepID=UPI0008D21416|nr:hypothetical protein [Chitinophaga sp. YR573]SEW37071.1 hypothetical protein SAMN05428988_4603 [Chitinophaga sp. YR573]
MRELLNLKNVNQMTINFIKHFNVVMSDFQDRQALYATLISLYVALFCDIITPAIIRIASWGKEIEPGVDRFIFEPEHSTYSTKKERGTQPETEHRPGSKMGPSYKQYINNVKQERVNGLTLKKKDIKILSQEEVEGYFHTYGLPQTEARKFFFYYQARGWIVKGSPIQDWESAARKWMLNTGFLPNEASTPGKLHVNQNKRYDIPL